MSKKLLLTAAGLLLDVLAAACEPTPVPDRTDEVWVDIDLGASGGAKATLPIAYKRRIELDEMRRDVGPAVFPNLVTRAGIDDNDSGAPLLVVTTTNAYEPG